ncbi:Spliceosome-associated protein CWC15 [Manis javanica]|nr:Spliceosome-associated protein CWC15 [Manis javanica]
MPISMKMHLNGFAHRNLLQRPELGDAGGKGTGKVESMCILKMKTEEDEDENFEEESDDDGTAALLAELEKIKKERAEEQARKNCQRCSVIHIKKS